MLRTRWAPGYSIPSSGFGVCWNHKRALQLLRLRFGSGQLKSTAELVTFPIYIANFGNIIVDQNEFGWKSSFLDSKIRLTRCIRISKKNEMSTVSFMHIYIYIVNIISTSNYGVSHYIIRQILTRPQMVDTGLVGNHAGRRPRWTKTVFSLINDIFEKAMRTLSYYWTKLYIGRLRTHGVFH